jgi:hypothetical protein
VQVENLCGLAGRSTGNVTTPSSSSRAMANLINAPRLRPDCLANARNSSSLSPGSISSTRLGAPMPFHASTIAAPSFATTFYGIMPSGLLVFSALVFSVPHPKVSGKSAREEDLGRKSSAYGFPGIPGTPPVFWLPDCSPGQSPPAPAR